MDCRLDPIRHTFPRSILVCKAALPVALASLYNLSSPAGALKSGCRYRRRLRQSPCQPRSPNSLPCPLIRSRRRPSRRSFCRFRFRCSPRRALPQNGGEKRSA